MVRILLGWCENEGCGIPIYEGTPHLVVESENGNKYVYCRGCKVKDVMPDEVKEEV